MDSRETRLAAKADPDRKWPPRRVGTIAAAVELGVEGAIAFAYEGMADSDAASLAHAVSEHLAREARRTGSWQAWARSSWLLPYSWGPGALEFQQRLDVSVRASTVVCRKDIVRKKTAGLAFRLLDAGLGTRDVLARLHAYNSTQPDPIPDDVVDQLAVWAGRKLRERSRAP